MRILPRSLAGQMILLIGVALLVAQLANMALLLNEREKANLAQAEGPAVARFADVVADHLVEGRNLPRGRGPRFVFVDASTVTESTRRTGLETRVRAALAEEGVTVRAVRASRRDAPMLWDPRLRDGGGPRGFGEGQAQPQAQAQAQAQGEGQAQPQGPDQRRDEDRRDGDGQGQGRGDDRDGRQNDGPPRWMEGRGFDGPPRAIRQVLISVQLTDGRWLEGRLATPRRDPAITTRLISATVVLYLIVLGVTLAIAAWLARPLRDLTRAAEGFAGRGPAVEIKPSGPGDLRRLIIAFNAMKVRVAGLLAEKDRMLGAIGHDLRTPLASLRLRVENLEPGEERDRMVATLQEAASMLEDILVLARTGRVREELRDVDVAGLLDAVAEEYGELGRPVTLEPSPRTVAQVQPGLLRRAIRNLVDNAVAYGGSATLSLVRGDGEIRIVVSDRGPGIADTDIDRVRAPFERGEESRNRETGGSGLGLAIADAIIQGHGGCLTLANREGGGLDAVLHLPG